MSEAQLTSVLDQLDQLEEIVLDGTRVPFSGGRLVNEQDAIELMDAVRDALPAQLTKADELVAKKEEFISQARQKAEEIVSQAKQQRDQLINSQSIRAEAERQVAELREQARQQCEQMLGQARQQLAKTDQEHQARLAQLEQQFSQRRQQLEQEALQRRQQLDQEALELKRQLADQHEQARKQSLTELEKVRVEAMRLQQSSQAEAERVQADALQFRQQTQQQCEALIGRSREEAATIQEGANRYAEQVLGELEDRLREMGQVVNAGRRELVRLQGINPASLVTTHVAGSDQAVSINRARRAADRIRRAAGQR
jgi:F0F1-type ATP synthase membrane subunit b/b'